MAEETTKEPQMFVPVDGDSDYSSEISSKDPTPGALNDDKRRSVLGAGTETLAGAAALAGPSIANSSIPERAERYLATRQRDRIRTRLNALEAELAERQGELDTIRERQRHNRIDPATEATLRDTIHDADFLGGGVNPATGAIDRATGVLSALDDPIDALRQIRIENDRNSSAHADAVMRELREQHAVRNSLNTVEAQLHEIYDDPFTFNETPYEERQALEMEREYLRQRLDASTGRLAGIQDPAAINFGPEWTQNRVQEYMDGFGRDTAERARAEAALRITQPELYEGWSQAERARILGEVAGTGASTDARSPSQIPLQRFDAAQTRANGLADLVSRIGDMDENGHINLRPITETTTVAEDPSLYRNRVRLTSEDAGATVRAAARDLAPYLMNDNTDGRVRPGQGTQPRTDPLTITQETSQAARNDTRRAQQLTGETRRGVGLDFRSIPTLEDAIEAQRGRLRAYDGNRNAEGGFVTDSNGNAQIGRLQELENDIARRRQGTGLGRTLKNTFRGKGGWLGTLATLVGGGALADGLTGLVNAASPVEFESGVDEEPKK